MGITCACYNLRRASRAVTQLFDGHFDEVVQKGSWTFGRKGAAYVALWSRNKTSWASDVFSASVVDKKLVISGKLEERGDQKQIILESVSSSLPEFNIRPKTAPCVVIELPLTGEYWDDVNLMQRLDEVLRQNEGDAEVVLVVEREGQLTRMRSRSRRVVWNEESAAEIEAVVGSGKAWLDPNTGVETAEAEMRKLARVTRNELFETTPGITPGCPRCGTCQAA